MITSIWDAMKRYQSGLGQTTLHPQLIMRVDTAELIYRGGAATQINDGRTVTVVPERADTK